jgi:hypothetical protein
MLKSGFPLPPDEELRKETPPDEVALYECMLAGVQRLADFGIERIHKPVDPSILDTFDWDNPLKEAVTAIDEEVTRRGGGGRGGSGGAEGGEGAEGRREGRRERTGRGRGVEGGEGRGGSGGAEGGEEGENSKGPRGGGAEGRQVFIVGAKPYIARVDPVEFDFQFCASDARQVQPTAYRLW